MNIALSTCYILEVIAMRKNATRLAVESRRICSKDNLKTESNLGHINYTIDLFHHDRYGRPGLDEPVFSFCSFLPHIEAMTKDFFIIVKLNLCLINYAVSQILNVNSF